MKFHGDVHNDAGYKNIFRISKNIVHGIRSFQDAVRELILGPNHINYT